MNEKLRSAANSLDKDLRSRYNDPLKPWFCVATRDTDKDPHLVIYYDRHPPTELTEWEGFPVKYKRTGIPKAGGPGAW